MDGAEVWEAAGLKERPWSRKNGIEVKKIRRVTDGFGLVYLREATQAEVARKPRKQLKNEFMLRDLK